MKNDSNLLTAVMWPPTPTMTQLGLYLDQGN